MTSQFPDIAKYRRGQILHDRNANLPETVLAQELGLWHGVAVSNFLHQNGVVGVSNDAFDTLDIQFTQMNTHSAC